MRRTICAVYI